MRRDLLVAGLQEIEGIECNLPQGAFYLFPRIEKLAMTGDQFCDLMLDHGVALAPGSAFGQGFEHYIRISYACSQEEIKEAVEIFKNVLA